MNKYQTTFVEFQATTRHLSLISEFECFENWSLLFENYLLFDD